MTASAEDMRAALPLLEKKLDLVLINEYWDESMVLLKREMCWTTEGGHNRLRPTKA